MRFKLFSLGAIEALLGPAAEAGATTGAPAGCFWITLNERDGEAGASDGLLDSGDGVRLVTGAGTETEAGAAAATGSATACG